MGLHSHLVECLYEKYVDGFHSCLLELFYGSEQVEPLSHVLGCFYENYLERLFFMPAEMVLGRLPGEAPLRFDEIVLCKLPQGVSLRPAGMVLIELPEGVRLRFAGMVL